MPRLEKLSAELRICRSALTDMGTGRGENGRGRRWGRCKWPYLGTMSTLDGWDGRGGEVIGWGGVGRGVVARGPMKEAEGGEASSAFVWRV